MRRVRDNRFRTSKAFDRLSIKYYMVALNNQRTLYRESGEASIDAIDLQK